MAVHIMAHAEPTPVLQIHCVIFFLRNQSINPRPLAEWGTVTSESTISIKKPGRSWGQILSAIKKITPQENILGVPLDTSNQLSRLLLPQLQAVSAEVEPGYGLLATTAASAP